MFVQPETLHPKLHQGLRFSRNQPYLFASEMMLLPLAASEVKKAGREMPIVFSLQMKSPPQALVGLEPGHNVHVNESGYWKGRYVPACLKAYPFRLIKLNETDQKFAMQIDIAADHFSTSDGDLLIDTKGHPTPLLKQAQQALITLYQDTRLAERQIEELERYSLLTIQHILINQGTDSERALTGFRTVDVEAFNALNSESLTQLRNSGALALVYAHFLSLTNLQDGLIAKTPSGKDTAPDLEEFFNDDEDLTFNFDD